MKAVALLIALTISAVGEDITTKDGKVYKSATIVSHDAMVVTVSYGNNEITTFPLSELSDSSLKKLQSEDAAAKKAADGVRAAAEDARRQEEAKAAQLTYADAVDLLNRIGDGSYDRFEDKYTYETTKQQVPAENAAGTLQAWINTISKGDHLTQSSFVTIYISREGTDWLWLNTRDPVIVMAGTERLAPTNIAFADKVLDDGNVLELMSFDIPVSSLNSMAARDDLGAKIGISTLDLSGDFTLAAKDFCRLYKFMPRLGQPVPTDTQHSTTYDEIVNDAANTNSVTPSSTAPIEDFHPGSISDSVTTPRQ